MTCAQSNTAAENIEGNRPEKPAQYRVWMCDPWCRTPWYTGALTKALQMQGHAIRLVCPSYHLEPDYFSTQGLHPAPGILNLAAYCRSVPDCMLRPLRLAEYAINRSALRISAAANPPHILHQQQCVLLEYGWKPELELLRWCRARGVRVVYTAHNLLPHREKAGYREIFAELYRIPDALISHDSESAEKLESEFGVERSRIHVIPHGPLFAEIPPASPSQCRTMLGIDPDRQVYLALGVLSPYKKIDLLLEAWTELLRLDVRRPPPLLVVAGNGPEPEKDRIRKIAAKLGIHGSAIRLDLHYIPSARLPFFLQAADVLLYPYQEITTSGALLTGLNYRKPIIASDLAAFRRYLHPNVNALLVPPDDGTALTHAMAALRDPINLARMEEGSWNNDSLHLQWNEIAARTAEVYTTLLH